MPQVLFLESMGLALILSVCPYLPNILHCLCHLLEHYFLNHCIILLLCVWAPHLHSFLSAHQINDLNVWIYMFMITWHVAWSLTIMTQLVTTVMTCNLISNFTKIKFYLFEIKSMTCSQLWNITYYQNSLKKNSSSMDYGWALRAKNRNLINVSYQIYQLYNMLTPQTSEAEKCFTVIINMHALGYCTLVYIPLLPIKNFITYSTLTNYV